MAAWRERLSAAFHDEFVSLRMNGLDYRQLRMVEEAWTVLRPATLESASPATNRLRKSDWRRCLGALLRQMRGRDGGGNDGGRNLESLVAKTRFRPRGRLT